MINLLFVRADKKNHDNTKSFINVDIVDKNT